MLFRLKASRCTKENSRKFPIDHLQETSRLFSHSLALTIFYCHLIKNYSRKISSLTQFLKKDSCFPLNDEAFRQFCQLEEAFTSAPILSHFSNSLPPIVETDSSDFSLGAVLSQASDSGKHCIAFDSCNLPPEELNFDIHEKDLIGIFWAPKHWRAFLLSLSSSFEVPTNTSFCQNFSLSVDHAELNSFLNHLPPWLLGKPSRCTVILGQCLPRKGEDIIRKNPMNYQQIIKQY
ncbi:hypothetical protein O181_009288 [Austropuccinia psidii MF-1]|uniref:Reverse transcriptase/retrotransposon-derived protein RNase H-like domain-containing protein n=1 Tax=Austropuccinia psidii MF-1 TaxID=1389203 RepID=A0A9Q3BR33_9BASI|nr:hypothetical protein [Austropuccinia psidii MF-1]